MVDKDFCLSSYMAFRYIWKKNVDFYEGFHHKNIQPVKRNKQVLVNTAEDIDSQIKKQFEKQFKQAAR